MLTQHTNIVIVLVYALRVVVLCASLCTAIVLQILGRFSPRFPRTPSPVADSDACLVISAAVRLTKQKTT